MHCKQIASTTLKSLRVGLISTAMVQLMIGNSFGAAPAQQGSKDAVTSTPIKHVIVIIGENRSFDHVFATDVPQKGESVWNLLSEGIIKADGAWNQFPKRKSACRL